MNMVEIGRTLLAVSFVGFLGLSIFFPLIAIPGYYFQTLLQSPAKLETAHPSSIEIIIPAHNEANIIGSTLESVLRSIRYFEGHSLHLSDIKVHVGADSCVDETARIARRFQNVQVTEFPKNGGKWLTLKALCENSSADWIILVDSGSLWFENFLSIVIPQMGKNPRTMAISPAYHPMTAGWLHHWVWRIEYFLKRVEGLCGGPVSVHGATVCYKTSCLKRTLAILGDRNWLNDDVVIPLGMRALFPDGVIVYPAAEVHDAGVRNDISDFARRKRMLAGNLQWLRALWPSCFRMNPVAGMVAMRRFFRLLWAYWFALTALGIGLRFHFLFAEMLIFASFGILSRNFRQLAAAAIVSFLAPFRALFPISELAEAWK
jgi:glycosyltransferase involved in cell wall biosynthesis